MRIVLQGGDNMLGRAVQLSLFYQSDGDENITDTQSAKDYFNDILSDIDINELRQLNLYGDYLFGNIPLNLNEDVRIINLEASPTYTIDTSSNKSIHYHVHIDNVNNIFSKFVNSYLLCLANNHALDMGKESFINETLPNVKNIIGVNLLPTMIGNLAICNFGCGCSGIPKEWSSYINYLPPIINDENVNIAFNVISKSFKNVNEIKILSIHWGPNWSYSNDGQEYRKKLAYRLIDELGISVIHGHSSHHIRGIELYKGKIIIYGAGDFINDYEKIPSKYNTYGALYVIDIDNSGNLTNLELLPVEMKNLQCKLTIDKDKIYNLIQFINKQSLQDCNYPLLLK